MERAAKTPHGSLGDGKRCNSSACSEDIRCRGRSVGTRFEEILPSPERCNQKSVFLGAPLSRCYHQVGMQRRLSARSSGVVESSRSGGGSDSELNHEASSCARAKSSLMSLVNDTEYRIMPGGFCSSSSNCA